MESRTHQESFKPTWQHEKSMMLAGLKETKHPPQPASEEEQNILMVGKLLYDKTRRLANPFMEGLYEQGKRTYFDSLLGEALNIDYTMLKQRQGEQPQKTFEEYTEESSSRIMHNLIEFYDHLEKQKYSGITTTETPSHERWKALAELDPNFLHIITAYDRNIKDFEELGAISSPWFIGLKGIQAHLHNRITDLDKKSQSVPAANTEENKADRINYSTHLIMEFVDNMEFALPTMDKKENKAKLEKVQNEALSYLDEHGIERKMPKIGDTFNPKWQMAIDGKGEKIVKVLKGYYGEKTSGKILQAAQVVVE